MQIIDRLETNRRGPYGGGIGHVSFTGSMDMALGLRTMVIPTTRDDTMYRYNRDGPAGKASTSSRKEWVVHIQVSSRMVRWIPFSIGMIQRVVPLSLMDL